MTPKYFAKSVFSTYTICAVMILLIFSSFAPVSSHEVCSSCADQSTPSYCDACGTFHPGGSHEPPPPPPTQADCDAAEAACDAAEAAAKVAWETAFIVCGVAVVEPTPAGELACAAMTSRAWAKTLYVGYKCSRAAEICSQVP